MKVGTRARYSLRMMMAIARLSTDNEPVGLGEVSRHCNLSRRYLEQLATVLRRASLVQSIAGRHGGYRLTREPEQISVREVFEAATGPVELTDCARDPENCMHSEFCNCLPLWSLLNQRITETLDSFTIADLLAAQLANKRNHLLRASPPDQRRTQPR